MRWTHETKADIAHYLVHFTLFWTRLLKKEERSFLVEINLHQISVTILSAQLHNAKKCYGAVNRVSVVIHLDWLIRVASSSDFGNGERKASLWNNSDKVSCARWNFVQLQFLPWCFLGDRAIYQSLESFLSRSCSWQTSKRWFRRWSRLQGERKIWRMNQTRFDEINVVAWRETRQWNWKLHDAKDWSEGQLAAATAFLSITFSRTTTFGLKGEALRKISQVLNR